MKADPLVAPPTRRLPPPPTPPLPLSHVQAPAAVAASDLKRRVPECKPDAYHPKRRLLMPAVENRCPPVCPTSGAASDRNILQSFVFGKMLRGKGEGLLNEMKDACKASVSSPVILHPTSGVGLGPTRSDTTSNVGTLSKSGESSLAEIGKGYPRFSESVVAVSSFWGGGLVIRECTGVFIKVEGLCAE